MSQDLSDYDPEIYSPDVIKKWYIVVRSTLRIMKLRGFDTTSTDQLGFFKRRSVDNIMRFSRHYVSKIQSNQGMTFATALNMLFTDESGSSTLVYFFDRPIDVSKKKQLKNEIYKAQTKKFIEYTQQLVSYNIKERILIIPRPFNAAAKADIINKSKVFTWNLLLRGDLLKNKYTPKMTRLSPDERRSIINGYLPENLPKMLLTDIMVIIHGWVKGDIIKCESQLGAASMLITKTTEYRIVI